MAQFIRFDNTDQHITYSDEWKLYPTLEWVKMRLIP